ncbi:hypothetical protein [Rhizobium sp. L43]|uniref:hypothetical protein n=1 Tax=Rhizobium sp. L43 TaxID=2035452 RepID=UPI000BE80941|nr:hypothetical protein [Rhizobium sp. L43]PDS77891.1 hypothetical protein CO667_14560 [Rhizobium sp. L43]
MSMQAAAADQGVALAWHRMITPMLARGASWITDMIFPAPGSYYLTWNRHHYDRENGPRMENGQIKVPTGPGLGSNRKLSPAASLLRDWIHDQAATERAQPSPQLQPRRASTE